MMEQLASGAAGFAWSLAFFVVALSVIVAVHEYGHYIVARLSGIGAEVFSIGFGPVIASRVDRRGTRWQLAALPFGGYVKFKGDADPASMRQVPGEGPAAVAGQSIQGAPLWARAATVFAGPLFNFVMAVLVLAALTMSMGRVSEPLTVSQALTPGGLVPGDVVRAVDGLPASTFEEINAAGAKIAGGGETVWTVERDGRTLDVDGPHPFPPLVKSVSPMSAASESDLRAGDVVTAVDGVPVTTFDELKDTIAASGGAAVQLTVLRDGATFEATMVPRRTDIPRREGGFETRYLIGIVGGVPFEAVHESVGPFSALADAVSQFGFLTRSSLAGMWSVLTGAISTCNINGPIGIAETSGAMAQQGLADYVYFLAVLSAAVGLINLFPIPILDGGHLVFHAYEAVSGRPPSDRAMRVLMAGGVAVIAALMVFALTNDLFCP